MQSTIRTENSHIVAKLVEFGEREGLKRVIVIEKPAIEDVLHYVHAHSFGSNYQIGIVWIKDAQGALHYGLLHKGHLVNDLIKLDDGTALDLHVFKHLSPVSGLLIRHISTSFEKANKELDTKPKLIP